MSGSVSGNEPGVELSVVLPSYYSAATAMKSVDRLTRHLEGFAGGWEIIVVDDGSGDLAAPLSNDSRVKLISLPRNVGKGAAIAAGMLEARGAVRLYTDVDLPYGLDAIVTAAEYILTRGFHAVIGDRTMYEAEYLSRKTWDRRIASRVFARLVGTLVTGGFFDTQCGLKAFRGDVAEILFRKIQLKGFAFDVEVVYLCLAYHLDVKKIPVVLEQHGSSSIRVVNQSLRMFFDVLTIKYHQLRGEYDDDRLHKIVARDFRLMSKRAAMRVTPHLPQEAISDD